MPPMTPPTSAPMFPETEAGRIHVSLVIVLLLFDKLIFGVTYGSFLKVTFRTQSVHMLGMKLNGMKLNEMKLNGLGMKLNGMKLNEMKLNGLGMKLNGLGMKLNGLGMKLNGLGMKLNGLGMKLNGLGMKLNSLGMKLRNDATMAVVKRKQAFTCAGYNINTIRDRSRPASIEQARNGCIS